MAMYYMYMMHEKKKTRVYFEECSLFVSFVMIISFDLASLSNQAVTGNRICIVIKLKVKKERKWNTVSY